MRVLQDKVRIAIAVFMSMFNLDENDPELEIFRRDMEYPGSYYFSTWIDSAKPWLKVPIEIEDNFLDEVQSVFDKATKYRGVVDQGCKGWFSVCLHGIGLGKTLAARHYGFSSESDAPYHWITEVESIAPRLTAYLKRIFDGAKLFRVRLMILEPGGVIDWHSDWAYPAKLSVNISLTNPKDCNFELKSIGTVPFTDKSAFMIDLSNEHSVVNNSDQTRYHIIVQGLFGNCSNIRKAVEGRA